MKEVCGIFRFHTHHFVAAYCIGKIGTDGMLGDEIVMEGILEVVLDPNDLEEAFWTGESDQNIDIALCTGIPPRTGAEYCDPPGIVLRQNSIR
ncbi:MAG: hypothetical protein PWP08_1235 [Methanofollis sp.]|nr:hypothetical protein [Methanofollis sp.]